MNDSQRVAFGMLNIGGSVAFTVFTWQHSVFGMIATFVVLLFISIAKDA